MDATDKKILALLQRDSEIAVQDIAEQVGLTTTPCWRRIQRLQQQGPISRKVALLDAEALGLKLTVFVQVKAARHDEQWLNEFARHCSAFEEVVEFYRMSGEYDYMLKVVVADMQSFDHFYKRLIKNMPMGDVTSSFAMEQIKYTTALPLSGI
ncbi:MAG: Lrp/AsnC family transcriptional regulator [Pseudomonadota bacterium]|jgi:Lrp/AsnC family transcriptional regulator|nr:transcriptional regulator [Alteromonas sp.]MDY6926308.1 Lrp/AsnC family transcriptional regulator [Pseudomonadota bacterium]HCA76263.1 transcriptional regulator [Alteromonas sp.]HCB16454.1 transcriptional regulator [Alteromonas sp.]HCL12331.1 transcriptional regulator [Alteromonas sp.]|tara:strand:- start:3358 stop:3816 length:459 start_codon:yes stop_codon:yes gene_type:complete